MRLLRFSSIVGSILLMALAPTALAQKGATLSAPHIGYIYPAGGQRGQMFQIVIGGQYLTGASEVRVTGGDVQVSVLKLERPLTGGEANDLREKLKALQQKRASGGKFSDEDQKMIAEIRKRLLTFKVKPSSPSIAETATLQITIGAKAEIGPREVRLATPAGLSNPIAFCVSQLTEFSEPMAMPNAGGPSESAMPITLPAVVNGQIMPGGANRYRFKAHKGDHLVFSVAARDLVPYIADAVPGWFQATLGIYDESGAELEYADHYQFHPDPVLYHEFAKDGEYTMEIKDALYRGREDFVYRITVGELPFVTSIFPLGGRQGVQTDVQLQGWNLPVTHLTPQISAAGTGQFCVHRGILDSNTAAFAVDTLPEGMEQKPNNSIESAQRVTMPIIVNGRIEHPGEQGIYRFDGRAGETVIAEVYARRLNSPLDSLLILTDATGKELARNDDYDDKAAGLLTHQADSFLRQALPTAGTYYLHISDAQHKGGSEYAYRLRISHPRPDFELRVTPSSVNARAGATAPITVYAIRRDGFTGDITLTLNHAPAGCVLVGNRIAAGQDMVKATVTVPPMSASEPFQIQLEGRGMVEGRTVTRTAVPAENMMQAFFYWHLVPADQWLLDVSERRNTFARADLKVASAMPIRIVSGGKARIDVLISKSPLLGPVEFELADPPDGLTLAIASQGPQGAEIVLMADPAKLKSGQKGNLIINAFASRLALNSTKPVKPNAAKRRLPLGTLPAVPFVVVGR